MNTLLKPAVLYEDQLKMAYRSIAFEDKYKYFTASNYFDFDIPLEDSTWRKIQLVSVNKKGDLIGFFSATIDRGDDAVSSLSIVNFYDLNYVFSKDFHQFLNDLFTKFNFRKVSFSVVVGNPSEKMYDKYIDKHGGRVVGIKNKDIKLQDNQYYDLKLYEIFRDDYMKNADRRIKNGKL